MTKHENHSKTGNPAPLSRHQIYFCPICYHLWNSSILEAESSSVLLTKQRSEIDPVSAVLGGRYAFTSQLDVILHLYHGHGLHIVPNVKVVEFLSLYQIRGPTGLAKTYISYNKFSANNSKLNVLRLLQSYWAEASRGRAYNIMVVEALSEKKRNIYGFHHTVPIADERQRVAERLWFQLTNALGLGLHSSLEDSVDSDEEYDMVDGYVFMHC